MACEGWGHNDPMISQQGSNLNVITTFLQILPKKKHMFHKDTKFKFYQYHHNINIDYQYHHDTNTNYHNDTNIDFHHDTNIDYHYDTNIDFIIVTQIQTLHDPSITLTQPLTLCQVLTSCSAYPSLVLSSVLSCSSCCCRLTFSATICLMTSSCCSVILCQLSNENIHQTQKTGIILLCSKDFKSNK